MVLALYWVSRYRVFMTTNPPPNQTHNAESDRGEYDALVQRIEDALTFYESAIEPDGSVSIAPVRQMAADLRARIFPPGGSDE